MGKRNDIDKAVRNIKNWSERSEWSDQLAAVFDAHHSSVWELIDISMEDLQQAIEEYDYGGMLFGVMFEDFLSLRFVLRFMKEVSGGSWPLSLLLFFLFGLGMRTLHRGRKRVVMLFLLGWLILPISLVICLDWWRGYIFAIRQILFVTPALLLGAAVGLQRLFETALAGKGRALPILTLILTAILGVGTVSLSDRKQQADWKALNRYLETEVAGKDKVVVPNVERVVSFRYRQLSDRKIDLESLPPRGTFIQRPPRIHLIESRYASSEQLRKIRETLSLYPPERTVDIRGFRIYVLGI